jgi:hypothetical protein
MQVTFCPTQPQADHFDTHIFQFTKQYPVNAHSIADGGTESTGLAYEDIGRMATYKGPKSFKGRSFEVPVWALNIPDLQRVLLRYLERRSGRLKCLSATGTLEQQIQNAESVIRQQMPRLEQRLDTLCAEYISLKSSDTDAERRQRIRCLITEYDAALIFNRDPVRILCAIIWKYFREGLNSSQISGDLGLKSCTIRQIIRRLTNESIELGYPEPNSINGRRMFSRSKRHKPRQVAA